MKSDIEISNECKMQHIKDIAKKLNLTEDQIEYYGRYKAKIDTNSIKENKHGKLILVTAMTPTKYGEGKTTVSIGLADALNKLNKNVVLALREPSLGPVFGIKGGAAGGGYSQVVPMEDINLHFTGDFHALTSANNLLCAVIDNHIFQGNKLNIDARTIMVKRCLDMNDRALRNIVVGLGGMSNGIPREDSFCITVATELMAIFCLSRTIDELKENIGNIIIGKNYNKEYIYAKDLKVEGAMTALLKDAFKPNLVQTLEGTPAIIHGGPFANIAHGCNSIIATETALKLGDFVVTEAGFGADLGAEKFMDIKCRRMNKTPDCVVLVATLRALKAHGKSKDPTKEDCRAIKLGFCNLLKHYHNLTDHFNVKVVVALNRFDFDTYAEIQTFDEFCKVENIEYEISEGFANGGNGCINLANKVLEKINNNEVKEFHYIYKNTDPLCIKLSKIINKIYGLQYYTEATSSINKKFIEYEKLFPEYSVCVAKTQYSLSDDPKILGVPQYENGSVCIKNIEVKNGAKFIVVHLGDILTMPGLPKEPNSEKIDIENNKIKGIF